MEFKLYLARNAVARSAVPSELRGASYRYRKIAILVYRPLTSAC